MSDDQTDAEPNRFSLEAQDAATVAEWANSPIYMKVLSVLCGLMMFTLVAFTFTDVVGRYGFNLPIFGGVDLVEFIMGLLVFSTIPLISARNDHITVSLFDGAFRGKVRRIQQVYILIASALVTGFIGLQMFNMAQYFVEIEEIGSMLDVKVAPVVFGMSMFAFVGCLLLVRLTIRYVKTGVEATHSTSDM